jgi:acetylornithine/succinyldiaminopimelate/putrescine aminotransferase
MTGHSVSYKFLSQLKAVAAANEAALIVDESNTGCGASG